LLEWFQAIMKGRAWLVISFTEMMYFMCRFSIFYLLHTIYTYNWWDINDLLQWCFL